MNKKAIGPEQLVVIVAIVIATIVFLTVLWPAFSSLLKGAGAQTECNWNLFLSAAVKAGSLGFAEIPVGCKAEYITVDSDTLAKSSNIAKKRLTKYQTDTTGYYSQAASTYNLDPSTPPSYDAINEWSLDSLMAKKMAQCMDKVWHGKLDIVARWKFTQRQFCIVCSVLSFSDDLPVIINKKEAIITLYDFLKTEQYYKKTYLDYAYDGIVKPPSKEYLAYSTKVPLAIVYTEQMPSWFSRLWIPVTFGATWAIAGGLTVATFGVAGPVAIGSAALLTGAGGYITAEASGKPSAEAAPNKFLVLWPYELLQKQPPEGGLACTDIIA